MTSKQVAEANRALTGGSAHEIIEWAVKRVRPDIAMSSSFQLQSLPSLHIVAGIAPDLPVIFLDTGYHFPQTLVFRDQLVEAWGAERAVSLHRPDRARASHRLQGATLPTSGQEREPKYTDTHYRGRGRGLRQGSAFG